MAMQVQVKGPCLCKVSFPAGGSLQELGYTRNMANMRHDAFFLNVPGDENGGDDGPPIDVIYLGEIAIVRLELTKWDATVAATVAARVAGGISGTPYTPGTLMFYQTKAGTLALVSTNGTRTYGRAIPRGAIEVGAGSKYSTLVCEFECHKDGNGKLYTDS